MKANIAILFLFSFTMIQAQISGNQVYNAKYSNQNTQKNNLSISDNHLSFTVNVLLNNKADSFTIVLGTNEEAETVALSNININKRINGFVNDLTTIKIKKENIYVDFISQTKVYDYSVENNSASQFQNGFEIKKNIIITSKNLTEIEKIITIASKYEIYDIIKVDYLNNDFMNIKKMLFDEAFAVAEVKKDIYTKAFKKTIVGTPNATEDFQTYYPKTQYKKYQAFENSEIETNYRGGNQNFIKKLARKNTTYYYDFEKIAEYDLVIDKTNAEIGIQYTLSLTITYKLNTAL